MTARQSRLALFLALESESKLHCQYGRSYLRYSGRPVLFLAQAIVTGLELPAAGAAAAKFEALKHAADAVLSAFAGILEKQRPLACKLPDAGMSHAHILLHSFGDKLDVTTTYDVFASDGDTGSSDGEVKQHAQIFLDAYGSLAGEL